MFRFFKRLFGQNPRKRGRRLAILAMTGFSAEQDRDKFRQISDTLSEFLESGQTISALLVREFIRRASKEYGLNPILFSLVISELLSVIDEREPATQSDAREFIAGIVEAINSIY